MPHYNNGNRNSKNNKYDDSYNYNRHSEFEDISSSSKHNKKKRKSGKIVANVFITILSILLAIGGSLMIYTYNVLDSMNFENIDDTSNDTSTKGLLNDSLVLNVLMFGSDSRSDSPEDGRSDSILMVSIDNRHKKLKLTSFLRDTFVEIPGYGYNKLNAAYAFGGPKLAVETIERNFGVDIDRYIVIDFQNFVSIVDVLGGVDVELTDDEAATINRILRVEHKSDKAEPIYGGGVHHLNGAQALAHSRNRDSALSDFDRTSRQRDVVFAIINEFKTASLPQLTSIVSEVGPMITTNFKKSEITSLLSNSLTYLNYPVSQRGAPERSECYDDYSDEGQSILKVTDWTDLRNKIATYIYEESFKGSSKSSSVSED